MLRKLKRGVLRLLSFLFPGSLAQRMTHWLSDKLMAELHGSCTDNFLELLLRSMETAFCLMKPYRRNIQDFKAKFVFATADGSVGTTVDFRGGGMKVRENPVQDPTVRVTFTSAEALRKFLFSENQDILDSILENEVALEGNINYVYRFGFLAKDLIRRLGLG